MDIKKTVAIVVFCAVFASSIKIANAGISSIVDNGDYSTDITSGLDWLDWSATQNQSGTTALANNSGWRYATASEANALMQELFGDITYTVNNVSYLSDLFQPVYNHMASLFGVTCDSCNNEGVYAQTFDYGLIGARDVDSDEIYAFNRHQPGNYDMRANMQVGIALVRSTNVPEPSTLAILALGIFALTARKFKK